MLSNQLQSILAQAKLTPFQAAKHVARLTGEAPKTVDFRLRRYLNNPPESITQLERTLEGLGLTLEIKVRTKA